MLKHQEPHQPRARNQSKTADQARVRKVPKRVTARGTRSAKALNPDKTHQFRYEAKLHEELPHVVNFSGGRSSGTLLFTLLEGDLLKPERDDVIV